MERTKNRKKMIRPKMKFGKAVGTSLIVAMRVKRQNMMKTEMK
jgi:hypothetical protein